jgi:hypothetical protein
VNAHWEYMSVVWRYSTAKRAEKKRTWRQELTITRPDQDGEIRLVWTSPSTDEAKTSVLDVLNELGAEGWELVAETVLDSEIFARLHGWESVGSPVLMKYLLKRLAAT